MGDGIYGPVWPVDGPPPQAPAHSLLGSIRIVQDVDADQIARWENGVAVYPFPPDDPTVHDSCATGTFREKPDGDVIGIPEFGAMCVVLAETCSSAGIFGAGISNEEAQRRFVARANAALAAIESKAVETEFMDGLVIGNNPHLGDGEGSFPAGNTALDVVEGFAYLEQEIADSGRAGVLHISPAVAIRASSVNLLHEDRAGLLRTINGTLVVVGDGYVGHSSPDGGHTAASATQQWVYATGPVEARRSEITQLPGSLAEALDRETNTVTYRVERYYVVTWDTVVQSAVRIDWTLTP